MLDIMISQFQQGFAAGLARAAEQVDQTASHKQEKMKHIMETTMTRYLQRLKQTIIDVMPFEDLVEHVFYPVYSKHFAMAEIQDMIAFFETPVGQKFIAVTPTLMQETIVLINQKYTPQFQAMNFKIVEEELANMQTALENLRKNTE